MINRPLIDTDVLIDNLRGQPEALAYLGGLTVLPLVSTITVAELFGGVREGAERRELDALLALLEKVDVDEEIAARGGLFRRDYRKSHNIGLPDTLIAATAEIKGATLVTLNKKHFPMLKDVFVPYLKP